MIARVVLPAYLAVSVLLSSLALADGRTDALIRYLETSVNARVRAQAALALAKQPPSPVIDAALTRGLQDPEPIVRSACEAALETARAARSRPRSRSTGDSVLVATAPGAEGMAPSRRRGFYVQIGMPTSKASGLAPRALLALRDELFDIVRGIDGVRVAPAGEDRASADRVLRTSGMTGYYLDPIVNKIERRADGMLSASVSIVVASYPDRSIKGMLTGGAAITRRGNEDELARKAMRAAFESALRRLPQAFAASGNEGPVGRADVTR